jgi:hypothetical protein
MKGPPRLLDDGASDTERSLLRAAQEDKPSDDWMRETRVVLGIATGVAAASSLASTAAAAKWGTPAVLKWIGVFIAAGTIVGSTTYALHRRFQRAPAPPVTVDDPRPRPANSLAPTPALAAEEQAPEEPPAAAPPRPERLAATPKTLTAEVASLDTVKQFLIAGNCSAALNALAKYHLSFPAPMLGPEATVLEVQALMAEGDAIHRARAIALARRFVKMHPTSPHAPQLEMLISKAREP